MRNLTFSSDSLSTKRRVIVEIKERLSLSVTRQSFTSGRDERKRHDDVDASLPIKSVGNKWNDDHWKSRKLLWASYSIGKDFWLWTSFYSTTSFFFFFFFLSYSKEDFPWKLVKFYSKVFVIGDLDLESGIVERFRRKLLDYSLTLLTRNFDNLVWQ